MAGLVYSVQGRWNDDEELLVQVNGDAQDEAWRIPSQHADQHGQPCIYLERERSTGPGHVTPRSVHAITTTHHGLTSCRYSIIMLCSNYVEGNIDSIPWGGLSTDDPWSRGFCT